MDIIEERQKMIEESDILKDLFEAKEALRDNKRKGVESGQLKEKIRKTDEFVKRRSNRLQKDNLESVPSDEDTDASGADTDASGADTDASDTEYEASDTDSETNTTEHPVIIKIDVEIKDEVFDELDTASYQDETDATAIAQTIIEEILSKIKDAKSEKQYKKFNCDKCTYKSKDNYNLQRHKSIMHTVSLMKCIICDEIFLDKFSYLNHNPSCYYSCPYVDCSKKFKILSKIEAHKRAHIKLLERMA